MFGAGYFSKSYFGEGFFGPHSLGGERSLWGVPDKAAKKEILKALVKKPVIETFIEIEKPKPIEIDLESLKESIIKGISPSDLKPPNEKAALLESEAEIALILAIIECL